MKLKCPKCLFPIKSGNMNPQTGTAVCASCRHIFHMNSVEEKKKKVLAIEKVVLLPRGFSATTNFSSFEVKFNSSILEGGWGLLLAGMAFLAPVLFIFWKLPEASSVNSPNNDINSWYMFLSLFLIAGMWILWQGLLGIINTISVKLNSTYLEISYSPINLGKRHRTRQYFVNEIEQIFIKKYLETGGDGPATTAYALNFLSSKENKIICLFKGFSRPEPAWFLKQKLQDYLGIDVRPVAGEYSFFDNGSSHFKEIFALSNEKIYKKEKY